MPVSRGVEFVLNISGNADRKLATLATTSTAYTAAASKAVPATAGLTKSLGGLKEATEKLQLGTLSRGLGMVQGALTALANPAGAAITAIGAMGVAGLAGAAALVKLTTSAKAWHDELQKAGQAENLLTTEEIRDVERMQSAFGDLGVELKRLAVIIGADLAPTVARAVEQMVDWLNAAEGLVKRIDWTGFFAGMVVGFSGVTDKIRGAMLISESWLKILTKIGILAPQVETSFGVDTNRSKFGEMAAPLATGVDDARALVPRGGGSSAGTEAKPVRVDLGDEYAAEAREQTALAAAAERILERQAAELARANQALSTIAAQQGQIAAGLAGTGLGVVGGLIKGAVEILVAMDDKLKQAGNFLIELPGNIGKGFEGALTRVLPRLVERLPKMIANALNLPFVILRAIVNAVPALIMGLVSAFLKGIQAIVDFFRGGEDRNVLTGEKGKVLGTSFKRGEFSLLGFFNKDDANHGENKRLERIKNRAKDIGSRITGGYIDRTGSYLLHAGERVVPPTGSSTSAAMAAMRGGGGKGGAKVNVTIGTAIGMDAREVARWVRRELGDYGTGASLTARG